MDQAVWQSLPSCDPGAVVTAHPNRQVGLHVTGASTEEPPAVPRGEATTQRERCDEGVRDPEQGNQAVPGASDVMAGEIQNRHPRGTRRLAEATNQSSSLN